MSRTMEGSAHTNGLTEHRRDSPNQLGIISSGLKRRDFLRSSSEIASPETVLISTLAKFFSGNSNVEW